MIAITMSEFNDTPSPPLKALVGDKAMLDVPAAGAPMPEPVVYLYSMTISLNVLNHLGIGLYSNVPAVISEVVANSWDADAQYVSITIDGTDDSITIIDDGKGMTRAEINSRYLRVGYKKRDIGNEGAITEGLKRNVMGRKGIGKLSVFSIAESVEVYSVKGGEKSAMQMSREDIRKAIEAIEGEGDYHPTPISTDPIDFEKGTKIVLRGIDNRLTTTETYLRRRLARRFTIIGAATKFEVVLDGKPINASDREFYEHLEFLWTFGTTDVGAQCKKLQKSTSLTDVVETGFEDDGTQYTWTVRGWIGTLDLPDRVDDDNKVVVVLANGKLIQEDILKEFREAGVYADYLIGEIEADFMDDSNEDDIVTSNRQSVKETDPRYVALRAYIREHLRVIKNSWAELRKERGAKAALERPAVKRWYDKLKGDNQKFARQLFGKIESLQLPDEDAKRELYKATIVAFEKLAFKHTLSSLEKIETKGEFALLARLFENIDELEAVYYHDIAKGRLEIIQTFKDLSTPATKEQALQQHLFDHLWLLHPSWERAASNARIEEKAVTEFADVTAGLTQEERDGRIDIRYRTAAGKHIIIELKRYGRKVTAGELGEQVDKYKRALLKLLKAKFPNESHNIECICIVSDAPEPKDDLQQVENILAAYNARYITYDTLIHDAIISYDEYLGKQSELSKILSTLDSLDKSDFDRVAPAKKTT